MTFFGLIICSTSADLVMQGIPYLYFYARHSHPCVFLIIKLTDAQKDIANTRQNKKNIKDPQKKVLSEGVQI